jgi:DNA-binding transcriptional regulator WhiA
MSEALHPEQIKALRKMTPARRLELSLGFIEQARELRAAMLRAEHPDWSAEKIAEALRDFVRNARA